MSRRPNPDHADLLLFNARVLTMAPGQAQASAVAVKDGRVLAVGTREGLDGVVGVGTRLVDCEGMTLTPGFHDAHCHFLPMASRLSQLDLRDRNARTIKDIRRLIGKQARLTPGGQWIRAHGYDEGMLWERRHPTAADLDAAAPNHPVRLDHRTGHATVLNTAAMRWLGIGGSFRGPIGGVVVRDDTGAPNGVFLEMTSEIGRTMKSLRSDEELLRSVRKANDLLLSKGVTAIQDAGWNNGPHQWNTFQRLKGVGAMTPRLTMMVGQAHADDDELRTMASREARTGEAAGAEAGLRLGAVKVMITATTGALHPSTQDLMQITVEHHRKGRHLAFHAIEAEAIAAAADAIHSAQQAHPRHGARHRIEHCAEAPPEILQLVKQCGAMVVTQPGFIHHNGAKYLDTVEPGLLPHLYPLADINALGIPWAASSDSPAVPVDPLLDIQASVTRQAADGRAIGTNQAVSVIRGLKAWTVDAASSSFQERQLGAISQGMLADLALLTDDPAAAAPNSISDIQVAMTIIGGRVVWKA